MDCCLLFTYYFTYRAYSKIGLTWSANTVSPGGEFNRETTSVLYKSDPCFYKFTQIWIQNKSLQVPLQATVMLCWIHFCQVGLYNNCTLQKNNNCKKSTLVVSLLNWPYVTLCLCNFRWGLIRGAYNQKEKLSHRSRDKTYYYRDVLQ